LALNRSNINIAPSILGLLGTRSERSAFLF
jgi:hypothetical protein